MKKIVVLSLVGFILAFSSCDSDENFDLNLVFQANYGDEILKMNSEYTLLDGTKMMINRSDMFLSDIKLIKDNGDAVVLAEVIQIDFANSPGGVSFELGSQKSDDFESIEFTLGLTEELNSTKPLDYPADSPLNNSGYYWTAWDSYIFSKTEGFVDSNNDGVLEKGWLFHTGTNELARKVKVVIDKRMSVDNGELRIAIDHRLFFVKDGEAINLDIIHEPTNVEVLGSFIDRMAESFSLVK